MDLLNDCSKELKRVNDTVTLISNGQAKNIDDVAEEINTSAGTAKNVVAKIRKGLKPRKVKLFYSRKNGYQFSEPIQYSVKIKEHFKRLRK